MAGSNTVPFSIRVSLDEKRRLEDEARREHIPPSTLARSILMKALCRREEGRASGRRDHADAA